MRGVTKILYKNVATKTFNQQIERICYVRYTTKNT